MIRCRDILFRCTRQWDSAPAHLRYPSCEWDDRHHVGIRIMLLVMYLLYLYNIFLIQRLLTQNDPSAETALLEVSSEILTLVLLLGRQQEPPIDIRSDFNSAVSSRIYQRHLKLTQYNIARGIRLLQRQHPHQSPPSPSPHRQPSPPHRLDGRAHPQPQRLHITCRSLGSTRDTECQPRAPWAGE